jgi:pimeloyl-ACP methyl ester carboxylesterase
MLSRRTPPIADAQGLLVPGSIASLEPVALGGMTQWLLIRGQQRSLPILLWLHGGPGGAQIGWARTFQRELEEHFVVVNWDQRGAGLSYSRKMPADALTLEQFTRDIIDLANHLRERFARPRIYLVGHSWGSVLGLLAAQQAPECFQVFVGVGQIVRQDESARLAWQWALQTARERGDRKAIQQLEQLGSPPYPDGKRSIRQLNRWTDRFRGQWHSGPINQAMSKPFLRSTEYTLWDKMRYFRGVAFSQRQVREKMTGVNLMERVPQVEVPVYFCMGRHDHVASTTLAQEYFDQLGAPKKTWIWFEESAHYPPFEEPEAFVKVLVQIQEEGGSL